MFMVVAILLVIYSTYAIKEIYLTNNPCLQLGALDNLLYEEQTTIFGEDFSFEDFDIAHAKAIPQQANATDCGLYLLKYMESLDQRKTTYEKVSLCSFNSTFIG